MGEGTIKTKAILLLGTCNGITVKNWKILPELLSQFYYRIPKQGKQSKNKLGETSCSISLNEYKEKKRNADKSSKIPKLQ